MEEIRQKDQEFLDLFLKKDTLSSGETHALILKSGREISLVTVKRDLSRLSAEGLLNIQGKGRARSYRISALGRMLSNVDSLRFCREEPDKRYGLDRFNFDLLPALPSDIFTSKELSELQGATESYRKRSADLPPATAKKELERLVIEFSWKSSKIEGNTYTLLDTERLILQNKEAAGHDKKEAIMILNHKEAFNFIHAHAKEFIALTRANLEEVHRLTVKNLNVNFGIRKKMVGVIGSKYRPLDNEYQIKEAVEALSIAIRRIESPFGKSLAALLGVSYIQPFEDGNKRTARLMADALLLAHNCAPLSYRSADEKDYREAMLVWYELNSFVPMKRIFIDQYLFAAKNYAASGGKVA